MYGKTYMGNERTTFVLDAEGKVTEASCGRSSRRSTTGSCWAR